MPLLFLLPFLFLILVFILAYFRSAIRGRQGEASVARRLKSLPQTEYTVFNDLLVKNNGYSSQIDHVVVSRYGVFVIETKNYNGWIYGGEHSEHWTQNIWGNKYRFYNPILQNQGHIKALKYHLSVHNFPFISIVAFSSNATLRSNFNNHDVCYIRDVVQHILRQKIILLSDVEVETTVNLLSKLPQCTRQERKQHVQQVKFTEYKNQRAVYKGRCPKCGGSLVPRTSQYGNFYGCSNYPRCKYTTK